ncbi:MAG: type II toxin-antitoxin system MqsA family antitoxin [Dehalococcoidia bacterium]|nr:type II toxin-antitoxin system MqsA family antitoxin [Dehalococcoidia bacterium]
MRCAICKVGTTIQGTGTVTLERGVTTVVFKKVPALVCNNCGERYYEEPVTARLLETAEEAVRSGVQVDVREYVAA